MQSPTVFVVLRSSLIAASRSTASCRFRTDSSSSWRTRADHGVSKRSAYNDRRAECQRAVSTIAEREPSVRSLRDVDEAMLDRCSDVVDQTADRRARHVIRENTRVLAMASALETGDLETVGRLMAESHASLRDLFEVSSPELDALVEIATATAGVIGSRMTGAGFGGCTVSLVRADQAEAFTARLTREYELRTGIVPKVWTVRAVDGAGVVGSGIGMRSA